MPLKFNPFTGNFDIVSSPGGSDTHIQFNDGGTFGGTTGLVWDDSKLKIKNDNLGTTIGSTYGIRLENTTAAGAGAIQNSPPLVFAGNSYEGANMPFDAMIYGQAIENTALGTRPGGRISFQINPSGLGWHECGFFHFNHGTSTQQISKFVVIGASGIVDDSSGYEFQVQNHDDHSFMQLINGQVVTEGNFFGAEGTGFSIYATDGGGIMMIPDTSESLVAHTLSTDGITTLSDTTTAAASLLILDQNDIDQPFIQYLGDGTIPSGLTENITSRTVGSIAGFVKVKINATGLFWMPYYTDPTS
jgi:hypothetical protein